MGKQSIWIGLAFFAFGLYEVVEGKIDESIMYFLVGIAFIVTWGSVKEELTPQTRKLLKTLSWVTIVGAGLMFLWLMRTDSQR